MLLIFDTCGSSYIFKSKWHVSPFSNSLLNNFDKKHVKNIYFRFFFAEDRIKDFKKIEVSRYSTKIRKHLFCALGDHHLNVFTFTLGTLVILRGRTGLEWCEIGFNAYRSGYVFGKSVSALRSVYTVENWLCFYLDPHIYNPDQAKILSSRSEKYVWSNQKGRTSAPTE